MITIVTEPAKLTTEWFVSHAKVGSKLYRASAGSREKSFNEILFMLAEDGHLVKDVTVCELCNDAGEAENVGGALVPCVCRL